MRPSYLFALALTLTGCLAPEETSVKLSSRAKDAAAGDAATAGSMDGAVGEGGASSGDSGAKPDGATETDGATGRDGSMETDAAKQCNKACPMPDQSYCDPELGDCAPCETAMHCAAFPTTTPVCKAGIGCVQCTDDTNGDALCEADGKVCKAGGNVCVECNVTGDCDAASDKPICAGDSCRGCQADEECTGGTTCDEASGKCVECTVDTELQQCTNGKACDPIAKTCTGATRGTIDICEACIADSECVENHRCIATVFGPTTIPQGGHCLKILSTECSEPYLATPITRASLSGVAATDYCGISESVTTCEAIAALEGGALCTGGDVALCDAAGALCKTVNGGPNRCTYACTLAAECPTAAPCKGPSGAKYCGGPNN